MSIAEYEKAIAIRPDYLLAHRYLGLALVQKRRYKDAISELEKVIALQPDFLDGYLDLSGALYLG